MLLVALPPGGLDASAAEVALERAHIAVNGAELPFGGNGAGPVRALRLGTPAVTTRGFGLAEIDVVADAIAEVLAHPESAETLGRVRERMRNLCARFPVYAEGGSTNG
jgi:glycine hydroxymethyltransferase